MNNASNRGKQVERQKVRQRTEEEKVTGSQHTPSKKRKNEKRDNRVEQPMSKREQEMAQAAQAKSEKEMLRSIGAQQISKQMPVSHHTLQQGIIWSEVLGAPVSKKRRNNRNGRTL